MIMTRRYPSLIGFALAFGAFSFVSPPARSDSDDYSQVERGRYLAIAGDCIACHTAPGGQAYAGGRGLVTPFGTVAATNLTPDIATGIGRWTSDEFYRAMHEGKHRDGSHLYPAFPYPFYTKVTRADSDAIFAFLRQLPPTSNAVDRNTLRFPFNIRVAMVAWNMLFFKPGQFEPDPSRSAEYNRGAYLTESLGHCGACHTPMNAFGANKTSEAYWGNELLGWVAPNITNDERTGLGRWRVEDIVTYLKTGHNRQTAASGPMAEVITYSTAKLKDEDLRAIAVYLKERGATAQNMPAAIAADDPQMQAGAAIYADTCKGCHTAAGTGISTIFPALAGNSSVQQKDPTSLVRVIVEGSKSAATDAEPTGPAMPSLGWRLSDEQIANVVTYIRNNWGNRAGRVSASDVAATKKEF